MPLRRPTEFVGRVANDDEEVTLQSDESGGVGETSRQKRVDVEQSMQQLRSMGQERAVRRLEKLRVRIFER